MSIDEAISYALAQHRSQIHQRSPNSGMNRDLVMRQGIGPVSVPATTHEVPSGGFGTSPPGRDFLSHLLSRKSSSFDFPRSVVGDDEEPVAVGHPPDRRRFGAAALGERRQQQVPGF